MGGIGTEHTVELKEDQVQWLQEMVEKHDLPDLGKAVRCLVNYAIDRPDDEAEIFEETRCFGC